MYANLWTSHVVSIASAKYYLLLVNDYSRYMWVFFFLSQKSQGKTTFHMFHNMIERQFIEKIKVVQIENGFGFLLLRTDYDKAKLIQRKTCPHTFEPNVDVESFLRHVNEIYLTLVLEASITINFWLF